MRFPDCKISSEGSIHMWTDSVVKSVWTVSKEQYEKEKEDPRRGEKKNPEKRK